MSARSDLRVAQGDDVAPVPVIVTTDGRPCCYPPDAVLTLDDVAALLGIKTKTVRTMGIRVAYATPQRPFVLYRWVVEYLEQRAA